MRTILALTLLFLSLGASAQQRVKITDPTAMRPAVNLGRNKAAMAGMQAQSIPAEQQELVVRYSEVSLWPEGIRTDSARKANQVYIPNYTAFPISFHMEDSVQMAILMVPAQQNLHMPEDMRPIADLYVVVPQAATEASKEQTPRPMISPGPRWKDLPEARITQVDALYATFDLAKDDEAMATLQRMGLNQAEIDAVIFRCHERNWPEGIDRFQRRQDKLKYFSKYKTYRLAAWENKVLLVVPAEKNKHMPASIRPYVDVYFVYTAKAVQVKEKKPKR